MQGCPRVIKTSLQRIIFCGISKHNWGNITQEKYLCNVNPKHTNIVLQVSNLCTVVLNLPGPTLYKAITCAVLADSSQSSQCWLDNVWQSVLWNSYLCNISQEHTVIFSQEDNLYCNVVLICLSQHCTRNYLCNVDPQYTNNSA